MREPIQRGLRQTRSLSRSCDLTASTGDFCASHPVAKRHTLRRLLQSCNATDDLDQASIAPTQMIGEGGDPVDRQSEEPADQHARRTSVAGPDRIVRPPPRDNSPPADRRSRREIRTLSPARRA